MPLHMTEQNYPALIALAATLTSSTGFLSDARAIGFKRAPDQPVFGAAVFEAFEGGRAMLHLGFGPGHRMTRETFAALQLFAFHPKALALRELRVRIAATDPHTLATAIKYGFQIEYRDRGGFAGTTDGIVLSLLPSAARLAG